MKDLAGLLIEGRRREVTEDMAREDASFRRSVSLTLVLLAAAVSLAVLLGYLFARRIAGPLSELVLQAEASAGHRAEVHAEDELQAISAHLHRLVEEVEGSSRALAEQRVKAAQAEKMSALGELATAIAHEVLNPLAGIKVALQLKASPDRWGTLEEMELRYIRAVYQLSGSNKVRAAEILGITRQTLARRLGEAE